MRMSLNTHTFTYVPQVLRVFLGSFAHTRESFLVTISCVVDFLYANTHTYTRTHTPMADTHKDELVKLLQKRAGTYIHMSVCMCVCVLVCMCVKVSACVPRRERESYFVHSHARTHTHVYAHATHTHTYTDLHSGAKHSDIHVTSTHTPEEERESHTLVTRLRKDPLLSLVLFRVAKNVYAQTPIHTPTHTHTGLHTQTHTDHVCPLFDPKRLEAYVVS